MQRIGLSATQKPIDEVARFLVGNDDTRGDCVIVDEGHRRAMDLAIEVPPSPLTAVMAHEVWAEYYDRLAALIAEHKTTLVFVNTRRLAERVARHLADRLGEFDPSVENPGRGTLFRLGDVSLYVDYAHNPAALATTGGHPVPSSLSRSAPRSRSAWSSGAIGRCRIRGTPSMR